MRRAKRTWDNRTSTHPRADHDRSSASRGTLSARDTHARSDPAGNLTFDGTHTLTYDAWNRLVQLNNAYRDPTEQLCERPFYALHDAQYNVLGIIEPTLDASANAVGSRLVERYEYTPYGQRKVYGSGWSIYDLNGDGEVTQADSSLVGSSGSRGDVTGDGTIYYGAQYTVFYANGTINYGDQYTVFLAIGTWSTRNDPRALTPRLGSYRSSAGVSLNAFGHQGLHHDEATGLVYNRARILHPVLGRFVQRDPLGYVDGMGTYQDRHSNPLIYSDDKGTEAEATASKGCCGLEVGKHLNTLLDNFEVQFAQTRPEDRVAACLSIYNPFENSADGLDWAEHAWDIGTFAFSKGLFSDGECGTGDCGEVEIEEGGVEGTAATVQVYQECHRPAEVNYVLFGVANRLCRNAGMTDRLLEKFPFYRLIPHEPYSSDFMNVSITARRVLMFGGAGTAGRQEWAGVGYAGGALKRDSTVKDCGVCDKNFEHDLDARMHYSPGVDNAITGQAGPVPN